MEDVKAAVASAKEKDFSKFGDAIRNSMKQKLSNHPKIKKAEDDIEYYNKIKDILQTIKPKEKPEVEPEEGGKPEPEE